jgi:broad specificity phosphatase PhoE
MLRILLVRHGETDWNRDRRIMGQQEVGLNETGKIQVFELHGEVHSTPVQAIYVSPILRTVQTAEILNKDRNLPLQPDRRLIEIDYGEWVGKTFEEVRNIDGYVPYFKRLETPVAPGGETLFQVRDRALGFLEDLKKQYSKENILVVSHADWIKCLLMAVLEIPFSNIWKFRIDNASVSLLECHQQGDRVLSLNQRGDLGRLFISKLGF